MFASPVFLLGSTLATILAALFDFIVGKSWPDLILYWFVGLVGFFLGQAMAGAIGLSLITLGNVHVLESSVCCILAMVLARWLKA